MKMSTNVTNQKSLNVLLFCHSSQLAGAERSMLEFTKQLIEDHQMNCSVVLPDEGPLKGKLEEVGATTIVIDYYWWCGTEQLLPDEIESRFTYSLSNVVNNLKN